MKSYFDLLEGIQRANRLAVASRKAITRSIQAKRSAEDSNLNFSNVVSLIRRGFSPSSDTFEKARAKTQDASTNIQRSQEKAARIRQAESSAKAKVERAKERRNLPPGSMESRQKALTGLKASLARYQKRLNTETNSNKLVPLVARIVRTHERIAAMQ